MRNGIQMILNTVINNMNFYEAWQFLSEHKIFILKGLEYFPMCLHIEVVKINPTTQEIDKKDELNTDVEVWLECGPPEEGIVGVAPTHDIDLDCGMPTFEEAIIELASLVKKKYG